MYDILHCLVYEHDLRLVVLAGILCVFSSYVAMSMLQRAILSQYLARAIWVVTGGAIGGFGIWATHFVAMLAYDPGIIIGYQLFLTIMSLLVAVGSTTLAICIAVYVKGREGSVAAGIVFGLGVTLMHFMGMNASEFAGYINWRLSLVFVAIGVAVLISVPSFLIANSNITKKKANIYASLVMALAIVSMHFTSMGAVNIVADPSLISPDNLISTNLLIVIVTVVTLCLLMAGLVAAFFAMRAEVVLAEGERKLSYFFSSVSDHAMCMLDSNGFVNNWNNGAHRALGYTADEIMGKHISVFYMPSDREERLPLRDLEFAKANTKFESEGFRLHASGAKIWAHIIIERNFNDQGDLIGYAMIIRDCTASFEASSKLKKASDDLQLALNNMANALCLFDENGKLSMYNRRLVEILDIDPTVQLEGLTLAQLCQLNPEYSQERLAEYQQLILRDGGEFVTLLASGKHVRITYTPTDTEAWVLTAEDVSSRVKSEQRIAHMARHDALTGLPNRRQFIEVLDQKIIESEQQGASVAIINIDLDRFKDINDTFGHAVGDEVLCELSERMNRVLKLDEVVGRFGGDEFVAMKQFRRHEELMDYISRLQAVFSTQIALEATTVTPGASLGVAIYPTDANDREKLLSNADMAMYRAKEDFDERVCFYEASMDEAERSRRMLAKDIWTGLREEQFFLHYQVQLEAVSHTITGYEVLLRWLHPVHGMIPPDVFIPIAEECGAISTLGEWVLERACADASAWPLKYKVAVNISPLQLTNSSLSDKVQSILERSGLEPSRLELEVTESAIIGDKLRALQILRQIKTLGVTIAIDDFGTGYSSLETLRSFPFDKIKLDRSFVSDLETDRQAKAFVRAIMALGKSLDVPVLAEGVETELQMKMLTDEGCDQFQGYYFGRPNTLEIIFHPEVGKIAVNQ